jgi:hypothetical protein
MPSEDEVFNQSFYEPAFIAVTMMRFRGRIPVEQLLPVIFIR